MSNAQQAAEQFALGGRVLDARPFGQGLINDTYLATTDRPGRVIVQRINRQVFPNPALIMGNLRTLRDHLRARRFSSNFCSGELRLPEVYPTLSGADFHVDAEGGFWRALGFIEGTRSVRSIESLAQAEEVGMALGRFHALTNDLEPARLHDTLPGFHVTPRYLAEFSRAAAQAGTGQMSAGLRFCLAFVEEHRRGAGVLEAAREEGRLVLRVTHGDPKLDNVLFDEVSGRAVGLVDLDTVQAGLVHHDLGDCLRSCCNRAGESPHEGAAEIDLGLCGAVLRGYFREARGFFTAQDYAYVYEAMRLIPFELGLRFLTDYLQGDRYFKADTPEQNLMRAMTQFRLAASIERKAGRIRRLIAALAPRWTRRRLGGMRGSGQA
jgi:Ser/Thr protein kinase RdoA (MazF antagonist)